MSTPVEHPKRDPVQRGTGNCDMDEWYDWMDGNYSVFQKKENEKARSLEDGSPPGSVAGISVQEAVRNQWI